MLAATIPSETVVDWDDEGQHPKHFPRQMDVEAGNKLETSLRIPQSDLDDQSQSRQSSSATRTHWSGFADFSGAVYSKQWLFKSLIVLIGIVATAAFIAMGINGSNDEDDQQFLYHAQDLTFQVRSSWQDYELFGLWAHESCHRRSERSDAFNRTEDIAGYIGFCSREEFRKLYEHIAGVGLKFQALQYIPNVTNDVRDELEAEAYDYYAEYYPYVPFDGYKMRVNNADGSGSTLPQVGEDFYFPIQYVEPVLGNEAAIGLNIYSNPPSVVALHEALSTWKPVITSRIKLVQEVDASAYSIILQHPGARTSLDTEEKTNAIAQLVVRIPDLLDHATADVTKESKIYVFDGQNFLGGVFVQEKNGEIARSSVTEIDYRDVSRVDYKHRLNSKVQVANREWTVVVLDVKDGVASDRFFIILGGTVILLACLLLALWFHWHLARVANESRIRSEAEATKAELAHLQAVRERQLNDFIAHEVRNPLSAALAALSFVTSSTAEIEDDSLKKSLQADLHVVGVSLHFINDLLRNMLDLHRVSNEQMQLNMTPTDLRRDVLDPVSTLLVMRCTNVDVSVECPHDLFVMADRLRLKQIILNLSYNAAKFVEKGFIRLRAQVVEGSVQLHVEDSGPGIPLGKRNQLFAKFQSSLDSLNQGTGIGLSVCKSLTKLMGAEIQLDDTFQSGIEGCPGTRFVLDLHQCPLMQPSIDKEVDEHERDLESSASEMSSTDDVSISSTQELPLNLSVLFVDDDTLLRRMFIRALQRVAPSWKVEQAANGETALQMVDNHTFDVIFVDQYMASIEKQLLGTETVRALRSKGVTAKICGLSANDVAQSFHEAGANSFMSKPFPCEKDALHHQLVKFVV